MKDIMQVKKDATEERHIPEKLYWYFVPQYYI